MNTSGFQNSYKLFSTGITRFRNPKQGTNSVSLKEQRADASVCSKMSMAQSRL